MKRARASILTAAFLFLGACSLDEVPDEIDEAHETTGSDEHEHGEPAPDDTEVEPGCTPRPTHWCETFTVSASYPNPGPYGTEIGYFGCRNRADAELLTTCEAGGLWEACCGGNQPSPSNHSHPWAEWSNGVWYCTGEMRIRRNCTAGSTNPECQPTCN